MERDLREQQYGLDWEGPYFYSMVITIQMLWWWEEWNDGVYGHGKSIDSMNKDKVC